MNFKIRKSYLGLFFWITIVFLSIGTSAFLFLENTETVYKNIWILPMIYGILTIISLNMYQKNILKIQYLIPLAYLFIRHVVSPFFMEITQYISYFNHIDRSDVNKGIILMSIETIFIFGSLIFISRRAPKISENSARLNISRYGIMPILLATMGLLITISFTAFPAFLDRFKSIYNFNRTGVFIDNTDFFGFERIIFTLTFFIFPWFRFLTTIYLFFRFSTAFNNKKIGLLLSVALIAVNGFFMEGANGLFLIYNIVFLLSLIRIYPNYSKKIFAIAGFISVIFLFSIIIQKTANYNTSNSIDDVSLLLQSYMPGVPNFAGIFNTRIFTKAEFFKGDILSMIPFNNYLFGTNHIRLVIPYTVQNNALSQILPFSGQNFIYFGVFFPFLTIATILIGVNTLNKAYKTNDLILFSTLCLSGLFFIMAPGFYNITILGERFFSIILPSYLIAKISKYNLR